MELCPVTSVERGLPAGDELTRRDDLVTWLNLYLKIEAGANAKNTVAAKTRDLRAFLTFFEITTGGRSVDHWTRSVTGEFLRHLERAGRTGTTINRVLATLKHCARWIHRQRRFVAGDPTDRVRDLRVDDPDWKGLTAVEVTRLKTAADQLVQLRRRQSQQPRRDLAIFLVLLRTGLRVSELLRLNLDQYEGKHLINVRRKGRAISRSVFLAQEAREALDDYLDDERGHEPGPLFLSRSGSRLARQHVDTALKSIAKQANTRLPKNQQIRIHAHALRHTCLRRAAEKHGVQYAMELSGQSSERYIWRYVKPSNAEKEAALEDLF